MWQGYRTDIRIYMISLSLHYYFKLDRHMIDPWRNGIIGRHASICWIDQREREVVGSYDWLGSSGWEGWRPTSNRRALLLPRARRPCQALYWAYPHWAHSHACCAPACFTAYIRSTRQAGLQYCKSTHDMATIGSEVGAVLSHTAQNSQRVDCHRVKKHSSIQIIV